MWRSLKILFWSFIVLLISLNLFILITGRTYLYKGVLNTYLQGRSGPDIAERHIFPNRKIEKGDPRPWPQASAYGDLDLQEEERAYLDSLRTASFLVFHRDSLLFEHYDEGFVRDSVSNSFSVAKSIVNVLAGIALREGHIEGLNEAVADHLPSFREGRKDEIRIRDLMEMRSGLNWEESGADPFSHNAQAYYGRDLKALIEGLKVVEEPGTRFNYQSGNTLILGALLRKATGRSLSEYAEEHLWRPIGAVHPAFWNLDQKDGMEKAFCCFYAIPRDFARIGRLYLQKGHWKGRQLVDSIYVERSLSPSGRKGKKTSFYGMFWWLEEYRSESVFYARGILGQYIIVVPDRELILVRTGRLRGEKNGKMHPGDLYKYLDIAYRLLEEKREA